MAPESSQLEPPYLQITAHYRDLIRSGALRDGERLPSARIISAEVVVAPSHVAEALGLNPDVGVIRRHRVTFRGDAPISTSTSWLDAALGTVAPRLLELERLPQGTSSYVEQQTGRVVGAGRDQVCASSADPLHANVLGLPEGSPVLRGRNWIIDTAGLAPCCKTHRLREY